MIDPRAHDASSTFKLRNNLPMDGRRDRRSDGRTDGRPDAPLIETGDASSTNKKDTSPRHLNSFRRILFFYFSSNILDSKI